jgi:hypothetical protein
MVWQARTAKTLLPALNEFLVHQQHHLLAHNLLLLVRRNSQLMHGLHSLQLHSRLLQL